MNMNYDYIGWGIGISSIIIALILAGKNKQLKSDRQIVNNAARNIQQNITNNSYNFSNDIKEDFEIIINHSNTSTMIKTTKKKNE